MRKVFQSCLPIPKLVPSVKETQLLRRDSHFELSEYLYCPLCYGQMCPLSQRNWIQQLALKDLTANNFDLTSWGGSDFNELTYVIIVTFESPQCFKDSRLLELGLSSDLARSILLDSEVSERTVSAVQDVQLVLHTNLTSCLKHLHNRLLKFNSYLQRLITNVD